MPLKTALLLQPSTTQVQKRRSPEFQLIARETVTTSLILLHGSVTTATDDATNYMTGDFDGSNNWEYICGEDSEGVKEAATNCNATNIFWNKKIAEFG